MRTVPKTPSLKRRVNSDDPKVRIVISCEGRNTEPGYFNDCVNHYGAGLVEIEVLPHYGVPMTVVRNAVARKDALTELARKSSRRGEYTIPFSVWAVFDKDDFDVMPAINLAREKKIHIAFSNPCFELWPALHLIEYAEYDGMHDRRYVQTRLRELMTGYDHDDGARIPFDRVKESVDLAFQRAAQLRSRREAEGIPLGRPSTTVDDLVRAIVNNGKRAFRGLLRPAG